MQQAPHTDPTATARRDPLADRWDLRAPRVAYPTFTLAELRDMVHRGEGGPDAYERALAQGARMARALGLGLGVILAKLTEGDILGRLGFSNVGDFAENLLGMQRRTAQGAAQLARGLAERPLLSGAVDAGLVSPAAALVVLPVARGDDEERWVERARVETVRRLAKLVRAELRERARLPGPDAAAEQAEADEEPWVHLRVPISDADRADLDRALALAGELMETPHRFAQLEALAQEYLSEHPGDEDCARTAQENVERRLHPLDVQTKRDAAEAALESETDQWVFLDPVQPIPAVELDPGSYATPEELATTAVALAHELKAVDDLLGHCSAVVKGTHTHRALGFVDFRHYARERLGLAPRTVETRAALEKQLWERPELAVAKDMGLNYSKLLLLRAVPQIDTLTWAMKAEKLTVVELKEAVQVKADAQMSALKVFEAWVPRSVAVLLEQGFLASFLAEVPAEEAGASAEVGPRCPHCLDGAFLGKVARHFLVAWGGDRMPARTVSQKQRRKYPRCCFPGCSRSSAHGHHIDYRSRGGSDDPSNTLPLCAYHHLVVVHQGFAQIFGRVADDLEFFVDGVKWEDAKFGRNRAERV